MSSFAAATYTPEMQVITLKRDFPAFADPENLLGFTTPQQIAMFTHEWMHYLHNVSTVLGLTTFCTLTTIWANFRWSFDPTGWSDSTAMLNDTAVLDIERQYQIMQTLRGRNVSSLPKNAELRHARFSSARLVLDTLSLPAALNRLKCGVEYGDPSLGEFEEFEATIGAHEILECAAFMLEERASIALGVLPERPSLDPYLLVPGLAGLLAPSLDQEGVLLAALASLQHPDPPSKLKELLKCGEDANKYCLDPHKAIREEGMRVLDEAWDSVEATRRQGESIFPLDEPMGRVVKLTISRMRANMLRRRENLFFELDIVNQLRNGPTILDGAIRTYGAPILIQEREKQGSELHADRDFCRDLMYDFSQKNESLKAISDGWLLMHASYRFVCAHFVGGKLRSTESASAMCPFYATCGNNYRRDYADRCRRTPWLANTAGHRTCEYAFAVHITRPSAAESNQNETLIES